MYRYIQQLKRKEEDKEEEKRESKGRKSEKARKRVRGERERGGCTFSFSVAACT